MNTVSQSLQSPQSRRPLTRQPPSHTSYTSLTPGSPKRNNTHSTIIDFDNRQFLAVTAQIPEPRLPEVPIFVVNNIGDPLSPSKIASNKVMPQGLLAPFIPAPYELGPDGLILITPFRIASYSGTNNQYSSPSKSK
jgi:hypothetical protein